MRVRLLLALVLAACAASPARRLARARTWAIQLQGLERPGAVDRLAAAPVDLVVIEPTRTSKGMASFPTRAVVARLRRGRLCLAYLNVGQAETYRTYWKPSWRPPGEPSFLLAPDPDGWADCIQVAYWDARWQVLLRAELDAILDDGFDGAFLDWVLGYEDASVQAAARAAGVDPAQAMADLVQALRAHARARRPGFLIVALHGAGLAARVPAFARCVDGVAQEGLSFRGRPTAGWDDPAAGDLPTDAALAREIQAGLVAARDAGLPVFTLDYAARPEHARAAVERSRDLGFVPAVSRTPLDRLP